MPHLVLQHSTHFSQEQMQRACDALHDTMVQAAIFPLGGIRVRAIACDAFAIADRRPENSFVDMVLRMGKGRTADQKKAVGQRMMMAAEEFFAMHLARRHFALSLEIIEIDESQSWKTNSIHDRLKQKS